MARTPLFAGLIVDEFDKPVEIASVGDEPCYVVDDFGFRRHIPSDEVDREVLVLMKSFLSGHEDIVSEQAAKMLGQDDIFSRASIAQQLKNIENTFDLLLKTGIPEEQRAYLGMMGFKVRINVHGDVLELVQPGISDSGDE